MHEKIIDSTSQQPIPGATVASGKQTVLTNAEDNFAANTDRGKNLTVSFVGYGTQTVTSLTRALAIQLSAASQQLIDVVVTALGVKKEQNVLAMLCDRQIVKI